MIGQCARGREIDMVFRKCSGSSDMPACRAIPQVGGLRDRPLPFATQKLSYKQVTWQIAVSLARARVSALANATMESIKNIRQYRAPHRTLTDRFRNFWHGSAMRDRRSN